jgi:hypothetical protein
VNRFTCYADDEEGIPASKKGSPTYAAYTFALEEWDLMRLMIDKAVHESESFQITRENHPWES